VVGQEVGYTFEHSCSTVGAKREGLALGSSGCTWAIDSAIISCAQTIRRIYERCRCYGPPPWKLLLPVKMPQVVDENFPLSS
jgi:hypothetical protein